MGIQYETADNKEVHILLQGDEDNYRAILVALQGVTGVPVSVAEKDREFVPVGFEPSAANGSSRPMRKRNFADPRMDHFGAVSPDSGVRQLLAGLLCPTNWRWPLLAFAIVPAFLLTIAGLGHAHRFTVVNPAHQLGPGKLVVF